MAPIRPQCSKMALSWTKESTYAGGVADGAITKFYEFNEPSLLDISQTREDDTDIVKGHEFPLQTGLDVVVAQDVSIPYTFPSSLSVLGFLSSMVCGNYAVSGTNPNYTHTAKVMDACTNDQPPSSAAMLGFLGDTASYYKTVGVCVNEFKVAMNGVGRLVVSGGLITDGTLTVNSGFSWPAASSHDSFVFGTHCDFLTANSGGSLVSKKSLLRGFEFSINNNLDVADGRGNAANAGKFLKSLRFGSRVITLMVKLQGHQGDEFHVDWLAEVVKDVEILIQINSNRSFDIRVKNCKIAQIKQSFEGIRDVIEVTYKAFYTTADASPIILTTKNGDAAYLL